MRVQRSNADSGAQVPRSPCSSRTCRIIPIAAVIQCETRIFAPQRIQVFIARLTYRQKLALFWLHYLAMIRFVVVGIALVWFEFAPGAEGHRIRDLLQWLWIGFLLLVMCLADLSGRTENIWSPQKPTRLLTEENI